MMIIHYDLQWLLALYLLFSNISLSSSLLHDIDAHTITILLISEYGKVNLPEFFKSISSIPPHIYISTELLEKRQYFTDQVKSVSFDRWQCLLLRMNFYQMTVFQCFCAYAVSQVFIQLFAFSIMSRSNFDTESSGSVSA